MLSTCFFHCLSIVSIVQFVIVHPVILDDAILLFISQVVQVMLKCPHFTFRLHCSFVLKMQYLLWLLLIVSYTFIS